MVLCQCCRPSTKGSLSVVIAAGVPSTTCASSRRQVRWCGRQILRQYAKHVSAVPNCSSFLPFRKTRSILAEIVLLGSRAAVRRGSWFPQTVPKHCNQVPAILGTASLSTLPPSQCTEQTRGTRSKVQQYCSNGVYPDQSAIVLCADGLFCANCLSLVCGVFCPHNRAILSAPTWSCFAFGIPISLSSMKRF